MPHFFLRCFLLSFLLSCGQPVVSCCSTCLVLASASNLRFQSHLLLGSSDGMQLKKQGLMSRALREGRPQVSQGKLIAARGAKLTRRKCVSHMHTRRRPALLAHSRSGIDAASQNRAFEAERFASQRDLVSSLASAKTSSPLRAREETDSHLSPSSPPTIASLQVRSWVPG